MSKKKSGWLVGLLILALLLGGAAYFLTRDYVIEITQQDLQQVIEKEFPISRDFLERFTLTLQDPRIELRAGSDRIRVNLTALTNIEYEKEKLKGNATLSSGVRYDPGEGAFYLTHTRVDDLDISLLPEKYLPALTLVSSLIAKALLNRDDPIYTLDLSDRIQLVAKLALKDIRIDDGVIKITFGLGKSVPQEP